MMPKINGHCVWKQNHRFHTLNTMRFQALHIMFHTINKINISHEIIEQIAAHDTIYGHIINPTDLVISIPYLTSFRTLYNGTIGWLNGQLFSLLIFDRPSCVSMDELARFANVIDIHNHRWCFRWCQCNFSHQSAPLWPAKMLRLNSFRLDKLKSFSLLPAGKWGTCLLWSVTPTFTFFIETRVFWP